MANTTFSSTVEYHFTEEVMVEIEYDAEVEYEKVEGSFSRHAPSSWDYYGYDELLVNSFKITKATLVVDGEDIREWNNEDNCGILNELMRNEEVENCVCKDVEDKFWEAL